MSDIDPSPTWPELLAYLQRGGQWGYWWTLPGKRSTWWPVGDPAPVPAGEVNVYYGVHPAGQAKAWDERTTIADVAAINCVFAELDAKHYGGDKRAAWQHLRELRLQPSAVIDSGGGYHAYWLLPEPFILANHEDRERARRLQSAWVRLAGGDKGAKDLARVLRVPGTHNVKPEYRPAMPEVRIVWADMRRLYELDELEAEAAQSPDEAPRPTPSGSRPSGGDAYGIAALTGELGKLRRTPNGARNDQLNLSAFALGTLVGAGRLERHDVEQELLAVAREIGLGERESRATIRSGLEAGERSPRQVTDRRQVPDEHDGRAPAAEPDRAPDEPTETCEGQRLTDMGNARRLALQHRDALRYTAAQGWLAWDSRRWARDEQSLGAMELAKRTARSLFREAERAAGRAMDALHAIEHATEAGDLAATAKAQTDKQAADKRTAAILSWAGKSQACQRLNAMLSLGQSEPELVSHVRYFDRDPWTLNCANGTLDLRTLELRPHRQADLLTKVSPAAYDPSARCPIWLAFLERIMDSNQDLIRFLQRAVGYSLTGRTSEQCLFFLYGTGKNGKSTFMGALAELMGDYGARTSAETLLVKHMDGGIPNDLAALAGSRLVVTSELSEGRRLNEGIIKDLTGGDRISARFLHREFFEFNPEFKLWMYGNHKPAIRGTDEGIWRRMRLVPFTVTIPEGERDGDLPEKLQGELAGILAWAVEGCQEWQRNGLRMPAEVTAATEAYRREQDVLGSFISECCVLADSASGRANDLYKRYLVWAEANNEKAITGKAFGTALSERSFDKAKDRHGWFYIGIGILTEE